MGNRNSGDLPQSAKPYTCQYDKVSFSESQKPVFLKAENLTQKLETINQKIIFLTNWIVQYLFIHSFNYFIIYLNGKPRVYESQTKLLPAQKCLSLLKEHLWDKELRVLSWGSGKESETLGIYSSEVRV